MGSPYTFIASKARIEAEGRVGKGAPVVGAGLAGGAVAGIVAMGMGASTSLAGAISAVGAEVTGGLAAQAIDFALGDQKGYNPTSTIESGVWSLWLWGLGRIVGAVGANIVARMFRLAVMKPPVVVPKPVAEAPLGNVVPQSVHYDVGRVPGPNPNNLRQRAVTTPTVDEGGVYLKPQSGQMKIGSTIDFRGRYGANAPDGIEVEIPLTRTGPAADDSAYRWSARRQRRFDKEYLDRITPPDVLYRDPSNPKSPVDPAKWDQYRRIFGYSNLPTDFGF